MAGHALFRERTGLNAHSPAGGHAQLMTSNAISGQEALFNLAVFTRPISEGC